MLLQACNQTNSQSQEPKGELETGFIPERPGMYDSRDTAVIVNINKTKEEIVFFNNIVKKNYTLSYDGTCRSMDKYGEMIAIDQLQAGEIVDIHFLKEKKKLASIQKSAEAFFYEKIDNYIIDEKNKEITIADKVFQYEEDLLIFSQGKEMELIDINKADKVSMTGLDRKIYSIRIDEGHGYLRLENEENMIDGWIEVGKNIIHKITEDMMLVVPEGNYEVLLSKGSITDRRRVEIKRDKETELDLGDLCGEEEKNYGKLIFSVEPDTAEVYIDGKAVDLSKPYELEYGIHQLMVKAEKYQTIIQYIKVGQPNATIQINLQEKKADSVSSNEIKEADKKNPGITTGGKLTISAPLGAELYLDGNYIGITPISVKKTEGMHVLVLRKSGYDTRSYTINIEDAETDQTMSFSELVKSEEVVEKEEKKEDDDSKNEEKKEDQEKKDDSVSTNDTKE